MKQIHRCKYEMVLQRIWPANRKFYMRINKFPEQSHSLCLFVFLSSLKPTVSMVDIEQKAIQFTY